VLDGIDLDIPAGSIEALRDPSGSGKTTLLNLIAGIDTPTSGTVIVAGDDIGRMNETQRASWRSRTVGFIFQFYNLMPVLTAAENVEFAAPPHEPRTQGADAPRRSALRLVDLSDRKDHTPRQLSVASSSASPSPAPSSRTRKSSSPTSRPETSIARARGRVRLLTTLNTTLGKTIVM